MCVVWTWAYRPSAGARCRSRQQASRGAATRPTVARVRARHVQMLLALAAVWGASFLFIRLCVDELGPVAVADGRLLLAAATLVLLLVPTGRLVRPRASARRYLLLGAVNAAAPFTLIALAETRLHA